MGDTKIRWTNKSWNPTSGCVQISAGCDHCYAKDLAERFRGSPAYPVGFDPIMKPNHLDDPRKWKVPQSIFVNSMSDLFVGAFPTDYIDAIFDVMLEVDRHVYQVLTKRPRRMRDYLNGSEGFLARRNLQMLPEHIWPGVTIENDLMTFRADVLREISAPVRMISAEPLLTPLPSLDLAGIGWVIVGGESGKGFRPMDHAWASDLRDRCVDAGVPFYFKQSSARQSERGQLLNGTERWEQRPVLARELDAIPA